MARLQGKVAFITGGTGGIGRAASIMFAQEGAKVAVCGRRAAEGEAVVAEITAAGGTALYIHTDVTEPDSVQAAIARTVAEFGKLNVLYNNAGGSKATDGPVTETDISVFWETIKLDLFGTYLCCKFGIPELIKAGGGSIINTASIMGAMGLPRRDAYTCAKGGVIALTKSLAVEYAEHNIRSNVIIPASVKTERVLAFIRTEPHLKKQIDRYLTDLVDPIDVAYAAVYLASDESRKTTAQILGVDCGILNT